MALGRNPKVDGLSTGLSFGATSVAWRLADLETRPEDGFQIPGDIGRQYTK
jgi:hypothetical protein